MSTENHFRTIVNWLHTAKIECLLSMKRGLIRQQTIELHSLSFENEKNLLEDLRKVQSEEARC